MVERQHRMPKTNPEATNPENLAAAGSARIHARGRRLKHVCRVGGAVLTGSVMVVAFAGWSAFWLLPMVLTFVALVSVAGAKFRRSVFVQIDDLEAARSAALAEALSKAQFLANMSHEIRTPMNGILGMSELLVRTNLDSEQEQMASTIQASADALLSVLNDILDYSKIEAGKLELEMADFDLWQTIDDCAGLLHSPADQKGVELLTFVDPRLVRCHRGDAARIRQVILNFVSNAVKFTIEGEVVLSADLVSEDDVSQVMRLSVRDTGVGITEHALKRLFMPFAQADASTTRRFGGTGLGLVICRRLVELMKGSIQVDSVPGKGSTFAFEVQLMKGDLANARSSATDVDLSGHSVLIVDDNETNRQLMVMQLAPTNLGMDVASNAISAIEVLRNAARRGTPFTMAILDMAMPGIDGMQLAEAIRNDPLIPALPVSLASSLGTRPGLAEMVAADVFRWLSKPLASGRLLQVVQDMASLRSGASCARPPKASVEVAPALLAAGGTIAELRVLVAEDNEINRRVLAGMLRRIGCEVVFAVDGREAVQFAMQKEFGLVLMDCQMPEMDGFEAAQAIRRRGGRFVDLPIVALTANVLPSDREACLAAGMNDFLAKPVKLDVLRAAIQRWGRGVTCGGMAGSAPSCAEPI
jgi:two-component system, sensor histidine kinase and response regulator